MHTLTPTPQPLSGQTVYCLEWLDFGPTGKTPKWEVTAFPNYEDETTDRAYALKCYRDIAAQDPDRIRLIQSDQRTQIIAGQGIEDTQPTVFYQPATSEPAVMPVWLTAKQLTLLTYLTCVQLRQLKEADGDPEPIATALQSDGRPTAERAGFLTMQLLQLLAAVELTHYRLVFIANQVTTQEQIQPLITAWRQCLPTAVIYQMALGEGADCLVWHLYLPANQGQPTDEQMIKAIAAAQVIANVDFDHQRGIYGDAYWTFVTQHPGTLINPTPSPTT